MTFCEFIWFYETQKWLLSQEYALLSKKEWKLPKFYVGQSLTKNVDGWPKKSTVDNESQILARKSTVDKKVNGGQKKPKVDPESQRYDYTVK